MPGLQTKSERSSVCSLEVKPTGEECKECNEEDSEGGEAHLKNLCAGSRVGSQRNE